MIECPSCARGFCNECDEVNCCCGGELTNTPVAILSSSTKGRPQKAIEELVDPRSTLRKRANVAKPRDPEGTCEWAMQKNCGGGKYPIVGCLNGKQLHTHHGDKDQSNNDPSNLHNICHHCHNRWHAANDKNLDTSIPHNPEPANVQEIIDAWMKKDGKN